VKRLLPALAVAALSLSPLFAMGGSESGPSQKVAIQRIDANCSAIQNAIMALKPTHLAFVSSKWKVLSDAQYTVAEKTHASITLVDVWKQGSNYAWVHSHTFDSSGNQRATQLCFRQVDGSLQRVRQATTVPGLSEASAQMAWFNSGGGLIEKTAVFEMNDPAIAKKISALPYYSVLP
jgi:hypothetical protein